jgi:hypothetical protein
MYALALFNSCGLVSMAVNADHGYSVRIYFPQEIDSHWEFMYKCAGNVKTLEAFYIFM